MSWQIFSADYIGRIAALLPLAVYHFTPRELCALYLFIGVAVNSVIQLQNMLAWHDDQPHLDYPVWVALCIYFSANVGFIKLDERFMDRERKPTKFRTASHNSYQYAHYQFIRIVVTRFCTRSPFSMHNAPIIALLVAETLGVTYLTYDWCVDFGSRVYLCVAARQYSSQHWHMAETCADIWDTGTLEPETESPTWKYFIARTYVLVQFALLICYQFST